MGLKEEQQKALDGLRPDQIKMEGDLGTIIDPKAVENLPHGLGQNEMLITYQQLLQNEAPDARRPKPLTYEIVNGVAKATFDREELRRYLATTSDTILWVEDAEGNRAPIRVEMLRETETG